MSVTAIVPIMRKPMAHQSFCSFLDQAIEVVQIIFVDGNDVLTDNDTACWSTTHLWRRLNRPSAGRLGAAERFLAVRYVTTMHVLHVDDDRFHEARATFRAMYRALPAEFIVPRTNLRACDGHGYDTMWHGKRTVIGLSALALTSLRLNRIFYQRMLHSRAHKCLGRGGNGEDIWFAWVAWHYDVHPTSVRGAIPTQPQTWTPSAYASYSSLVSHYRKRKKLCRRAHRWSGTRHGVCAVV